MNARPAAEFGAALRQAREVAARNGDWRLPHWDVAALVVEHDRLVADLAAVTAQRDEGDRRAAAATAILARITEPDGQWRTMEIIEAAAAALRGER